MTAAESKLISEDRKKVKVAEYGEVEWVGRMSDHLRNMGALSSLWGRVPPSPPCFGGHPRISNSDNCQQVWASGSARLT